MLIMIGFMEKLVFVHEKTRKIQCPYRSGGANERQVQAQHTKIEYP